MTTAIALAAHECTFDYDYTSIADVKVETVEDPKTGKKTVSSVIIKDEELLPTPRFFTSLYSRFGFNESIHKYFSHEEVFDRIKEKESNDRVRICIERDINGKGTLMGVSNPKKPVVVYDELMELLTRYHGDSVMYHNGIVESTHAPRSGGAEFEVAGDKFFNRFMMASPIDGYGAPNLYLALLRQVCSNGMVGYSKAFKSTLSLGKGEDDVTPTLTRALDGFNNEEGYVAIRQRIEMAAKSWSSVYETQKLYNLIVKLHAKRLVEDMGGMDLTIAPKMRSLIGPRVALASEQDGQAEGGLGSPLITAFHKMTGDTSRIYGLANLESLTQKRQRALPVRCTVYDTINFATEIATHFAKPEGARMLQAYVGDLVTEEYDMEGTTDKFGSFADFLITQKGVAGIDGTSGGKGTVDTHKGIVPSNN